MRKLFVSSFLFITLFSFGQPTINSFTPSSGIVGSSVIISGNNFNANAVNNIVYFGAVKAAVTAASTTSLTVTVPAGVTHQPISVTTGGLTGYSSKPFIITFPNRDTVFRSTTFSPKSNQTGFTSVYALSIVDMDGDSKPDIIATEGGSNKIAVLLNQGRITFGNKTSNATNNNPTGMISIDLDGDGKPDIVTLNNNFDGSQATISLYRNAGISTNVVLFEPKQDVVVSNASVKILSADINSDGKPDIVLGTSDSVSVFLNNSSTGNLSLATRTDYKTGVSVSGNKMALGDLDGDGKPELILGNNLGQISVFKTNLTGGFAFDTGVDFATVNAPAIPIICDIDGDGKNDIIVVNNVSNRLSILRNTSSGSTFTFATALTFETNILPLMVIASDLDGDGKPDLIVGDGKNFDSLSVFRNTSVAGNVSLNAKQVYAAGTRLSLSGMAAGDLDGDGKPDLLLSNGTSVSVWRNRISEPIITSVLPLSAQSGDTLTLIGSNFTGINSVNIGTKAASSFLVVSDTLLKAIVSSNGSSGSIVVSNAYGKDSLAGFVYINPEIKLLDTTKTRIDLIAIKGSYSSLNTFFFSGKQLQSDVTITAPTYFQVSKYADSGFTSLISLSPLNKKVDSAKIYVRFKNDSTMNTITGNILLQSTGAVSKSFFVTGKNCDSTILISPQINTMLNDSIICFKDSLVLTSPPGNYTIFKWSNGDSVRSIVAKNSVNINLQVGVTQGCLSKPSATLKLIKNTNPLPVLALTNNDTVLISSNAPNYRWFFNNISVSGNSSNSLIVKKIGFYSVETSNDKICWNRSTDFPILYLKTPLINDTVSIKTYPNPTSTGLFYIVASLQKATNVVARAIVTDANGVVLLQTNKFIFFGREIKIPVTLSIKGTVFAKIEINGDIKTQTVILQ
jgi:hypothetical protein